MSKQKKQKPAKDKNAFDPNFKPDPDFKAAVPTKVLKAVRGTQTVIRNLYGPVSPERLAFEQKDVEYRADQLNPVQKRPERIERDPGVYIGSDEFRTQRKGRGVSIG